jgi:hypothetical protein
VLLAVAGALSVSGAAPSAGVSLPAVKHVFVIVLENESATTTFGSSSPAPYLAKTLVAQGAFIPNYYGIGHASLDNYIAIISGQAPNPTTQSDCQTFSEFTVTAPATSDGQAVGSGCVYPASVQTLPGQLDAAGLTWRAYMDTMGDDPAREAGACGHPAIGTADQTQAATAADQYATRHDPFVYFHSIIDSDAYCKAHVVPLTDLSGDLSSYASTPSFSFISPSLCNDGHDAPCANGQPGGLAQANTFLSSVIPQIEASAAYKKDGLIAIIFDESEGSDAAACCNEPTGPKVTQPGRTGPGGGRTGAVLLSPFITPGTVTQTAYNHYGLLRSLEDIFGLSHLGFAGQAGLTAFGSDLFATPTPTTTTTTSTTTTSTSTTTTTTKVPALRAHLISVAVARHGKKLVLSVRLSVSGPASVGLVLTVGGRHEGAKTFAVKAGTSDLMLSIGGSPAGTGRLKITASAPHRRPATLSATVTVPA